MQDQFSILIQWAFDGTDLFLCSTFQPIRQGFQENGIPPMSRGRGEKTTFVKNAPLLRTLGCSGDV